jgi:hypothetical protein
MDAAIMYLEQHEHGINVVWSGGQLCTTGHDSFLKAPEHHR